LPYDIHRIFLFSFSLHHIQAFCSHSIAPREISRTWKVVFVKTTNYDVVLANSKTVVFSWYMILSPEVKIGTVDPVGLLVGLLFWGCNLILIYTPLNKYYYDFISNSNSFSEVYFGLWDCIYVLKLTFEIQTCIIKVHFKNKK
jgi:hypothetical protein